MDGRDLTFLCSTIRAASQRQVAQLTKVVEKLDQIADLMALLVEKNEDEGA